MTKEELIELARPLAALAGADVENVTCIFINPTGVTVEWFTQGTFQSHTVEVAR